MKKYFVLAGMCLTVLLFSNCHSTKKVTTTTTTVEAPKIRYESSVQTVIAANCTPCHFPAKGGNKKPLDTYAAVQANIDDMIRRIELNPTDRGFMPFKHAKLSDSTIAIFKQWKADGMMEK